MCLVNKQRCDEVRVRIDDAHNWQKINKKNRAMLTCSWYFPTKELPPISTFVQSEMYFYSFKWHMVNRPYTHLAVQNSQGTVKSRTDYGIPLERKFKVLYLLCKDRSQQFSQSLLCPAISYPTSNLWMNMWGQNCITWCFFSTIQNSWNSSAGSDYLPVHYFVLM